MIQAKSIEPIEYDINSPFPYNNYIYFVTLSSQTTTLLQIRSPSQSDTDHNGSPQPGTIPLPAHTTSFIIRLANADPRTGINNTNRIESEVAFMMLVREALASSKYRHIIPDVYAWAPTSSGPSGQGFSMQEYKWGTIPYRGFDKLSLEDKSVVFGQMADILALLQKFEVPGTVEKFGGLKFDGEGRIISAQMSLYKGEPTTSYKDFMTAIFRVKLQEADENPVIQGWRGNGVRARIEQFINVRLGEILKGYEGVRKSLVHSDFSKFSLSYTAFFPFFSLLYPFIFFGTILTSTPPQQHGISSSTPPLSK